jgi:hypothetical protein
MREAFRLNKEVLLQPFLRQDETFCVGIVYVGKEIFDFNTFEVKLKASFSKLEKANKAV